MKLRKHLLSIGVTSSAGWSMRLVGRGEVRYRERGRNVVIGGERLADGTLSMCSQADWDLHSRWDPPHAGEPIAKDEWNRILNNVQTGLRHLKIPFRTSSDP